MIALTEIMAKLRWYPGDPLVEIKEDDLKRMAEKYGTNISREEVIGKNRETRGGITYEDTVDSKLEEITQTVVTVSAQSEEAFRKSMSELIRKYRAPRTVYGTWGSSPKGEEITRELMGQDDGW